MKMIDQFFDTIANTPLLPEVLRDKVVCVDISNVAKFFYEDNPQEHWSYRHDFPSMVSPFTLGWYEAVAPKRTNSNGRIVEVALPPRLGWMVATIRLKPDFVTGSSNRSFLSYLFGVETPQAPFEKTLNARIARSGEEVGWLQIITLYMSDQRRIMRVGTTVEYLNAASIRILDGIAVIADKKEEEFADFYCMNLQLYFAFSLMHCKNVERVQSARDHKLDRVLEKKGRPPRFTFHTLNIEPMKKVLRYEGESEKTGLKRALHICRGHFADYTEGKGLFGKYHGRYWIPQTVKGSIEAGEARKDYRVKAGKGAQ
jgi:hypothetical protein